MRRDDLTHGHNVESNERASDRGQRTSRIRDRTHFEWTAGGPLPNNLSRLAEQVADLVLEIPPGRWVSWGDLGDALGTTGKAVAEAGLTLSPTPGEALMPPQWRVPWHRVRMADGSHQAPGFVTPEQDWEIIRIASEWWEAEGGRWAGVRGGRYDPAQRVPLR
jgi:alkylated DNA nucleotide flippase Atl1